MGGWDQLGSEDAGPQRGHSQFGMSGSNITLDSFFGDLESEVDEQHHQEQSMGDLESVEEEDDEEYEPGVTFSNQDELPRLPIPNLEETANKLLQFLEALQSPEQKLEAQQQVLEFIKGDGPKLQALLREYEQTGIEEGMLGSYIEEFWNESNIVPSPADDDTLPPTSSPSLSNPFFLLEDSPDPEFARHPIRRAASLTVAAMKVASAIRDESFPPDTFKEHPLCMDQYKAVFGAARVPQIRGGDDIDVYPNSTHVVVMCRNQLYYFQAMWPDTCVLAVDEEDVVDILTAIDRNSRELDTLKAAQTCPGVLTTLPRREWARIRLKLSACDERNAQYLTIIDSALFVVVLDDDFKPTSVDNAAANMLHGTMVVDHDSKNAKERTFGGTGRNRWYDKLQIIVCGDGTAGVNFENSAIDSHTALRIVSDIYAETVVQFLQSITKHLPSKGKIPSIVPATTERAGHNVSGGQSDRPELDVLPKKITFELPEVVERQIFHAAVTLGDEIRSSDTKILVFRDFGKRFIVSNNFSPDSIVQMSIMLAYYKLYGKMVCVYEPVLTKTFFHGRTEAMRSATVPAKDLCEIFFDSKAQLFSKMAVLKRALLVHKRLVKECADGRGVDRHLYALKCMAEKSHLPIPPFFESEAWHMLNHTVLLAANCGNPSLRLFGLSPVVPDGFGIGYIIKDYTIHFCITSKRRQTSRFVTALNAVLKEFLNLLEKHTVPGRPNTLGKRLCDIIEEVPEGKASTNDDTEDRSYDMWGLARPSVQDIHFASPKPATRAAAAPAPSSSSVNRLGRWDHEGSEHHTNTRMQAMMIPIAPLSDDESSSRGGDSSRGGGGGQQLPRPPRRSRRKKAPVTPTLSNDNNPSLVAPPSIPQRRGSMFSGRVSRRKSLSTEELNQSGATFDFDISDRSDPYLY